jgi:hypothetical protein
MISPPPQFQLIHCPTTWWCKKCSTFKPSKEFFPSYIRKYYHCCKKCRLDQRKSLRAENRSLTNIAFPSSHSPPMLGALKKQELKRMLEYAKQYSKQHQNTHQKGLCRITKKFVPELLRVFDNCSAISKDTEHLMLIPFNPLLPLSCSNIIPVTL